MDAPSEVGGRESKTSGHLLHELSWTFQARLLSEFLGFCAALALCLSPRVCARCERLMCGPVSVHCRGRYSSIQVELHRRWRLSIIGTTAATLVLPWRPIVACTPSKLVIERDNSQVCLSKFLSFQVNVMSSFCFLISCSKTIKHGSANVSKARSNCSQMHAAICENHFIRGLLDIHSLARRTLASFPLSAAVGYLSIACPHRKQSMTVAVNH